MTTSTTDRHVRTTRAPVAQLSPSARRIWQLVDATEDVASTFDRHDETGLALARALRALRTACWPAADRDREDGPR